MNPVDLMSANRKIHEKANFYRGLFLNRVAVIDSTISTMLANYFCPTDKRKWQLLRSKALSNSIQRKKELLFEIVQKDYPDYWNDHKEHLEPLTEIIKFRNQLAHSMLDTSEDALKRPLAEGVGFLDWNNGSPVTDLYFDEFVVKTTMVLSCLSDITTLLPYIENPLRA